MSYKTEFASNNADLQTILDVVNSLPDKKSTVDVTVKFSYDLSANVGQVNEVIIDGVSYSLSDSAVSDWTDLTKVFAVAIGTEITVNCIRGYSMSGKGGIFYNGAQKDVSTQTGTNSFTFTVNGDTTIDCYAISGSANYRYGTITITGNEAQDTDTESTFFPTDSGGTTYKSKFADNNVDLRAMLDTINAL